MWAFFLDAEWKGEKSNKHLQFLCVKKAVKYKILL